MWRSVRQEFEQRRQYLIVILLGSLVTVVGVLLSLSSLRASNSANRFLGPIFVFSGFSAVLFGVRWRRTMIAAEQTQQIILTMGQLERSFPPLSVTNSNRNGLHHRSGVEWSGDGGSGGGENKFLVAPPYSSVSYPSEPPPPYEPPDYYDNGTTSTSNNPHTTTNVPYDPSTSNPISTGTTPTLTYVQPVSEISEPLQQQMRQQWSESSPVVSQQ